MTLRWAREGPGDSLNYANVRQDSLAFLRAKFLSRFGMPRNNAAGRHDQGVENDQHAERESEVHPHLDVRKMTTRADGVVVDELERVLGRRFGGSRIVARLASALKPLSRRVEKW